ncbi:MAG: cysteine hydrolase [Clostridiales Family XIII bacterium]|jgi:nicotinamidase-related amidase|nr:cysteine hydrolase [Clostridiales Family XIII bacterium]
MNKFLIVIDMQKDFIDGSLGTKEAQAILPRVLEKVRGFEGSILFTYDTHDEDYLSTQEGRKLPVPHCVEGTPGWRMPKELEDLRFTVGGKAFSKPSFGSKELGEYLEMENRARPIGSVELAGLCTDICVIANAFVIKTFLPETEVIVDASCCAGTTPESHERALAAMAACQVTVA